MQRLTRQNTNSTEQLPIKIVQFGEGNFLRAFVDFAIDKMNESTDFDAGVAVVQPLPGGMIAMLNEQDGLYNVFTKGISNGKELEAVRTITCIQKSIDPYINYEDYLKLAEEPELEFVFSNTTEAGIAFDANDSHLGGAQNSFPGKLTALLYKRFEHFKGDPSKGLTIIPCELINHNADTLKTIILKYAELWNLGIEFVSWIETNNRFHNTLVDRIVPGYPRNDIEAYQSQLDFEDHLIVSAETFFLWVIEGGQELIGKFPVDSIDENILVVKDMQPYRTRKVRILNGAHTAMVPFSILYGNETVKETMDDGFTGNFVKRAVFDEIIPTLDLPREELESFAEDILDRFRNPFIVHRLESIALNSISKFKVRVLPSLLEYQKSNDSLPFHLVFAFACLIRFYKGSWKGQSLPLNDDDKIIATMKDYWSVDDYQKVATEVLGHTEFWDVDLNTIEGLTTKVAEILEAIEAKGIEQAYNATK